MRKSFIGIGILLAIVGLLMLFSPDAWIKAVVIIVGIAAILNGIFNLIQLRNMILDRSYKRTILIRGIISIIIGLIAVIMPLTVAASIWAIMLYILAGYLIISSILELYATIKIKNSGLDTKPFYGEIIGSTVLAIVLLLMSTKGFGLILIRILGILVILFGIGIIFWEYKNKKKSDFQD